MSDVEDCSVLVAGDTLVDFMPNEPGPVDGDTTYDPKFGGSAANVALAMDRLGVAPLFWTRVGTDGFGDFLAKQLADSGVPDTYVQRDAGAKTTLAFVSHDDRGEPRFSFYRTGTADTRMQPGTVTDETLERISWVHLTGVSLSVEPARSALLELAERAREHGCTVSLDPNARPEMWQSRQEYAAVVRGTLKHVDVLKASRDDLAIAGFDTDDTGQLVRDVAALGPHTVLLTLGSEGSLSYGTDDSPLSGLTRHHGYDVEAVDTTGAGDGFLAAAIIATVSGVTDADRLLSVANAVGAVATTRPGAVSALTETDRIRGLCGDVPWR
ncbi:MAG: carbohydrate kinase family protein [Haloarculaceae archaeon]